MHTLLALRAKHQAALLLLVAELREERQAEDWDEIEAKVLLA